MGKGNESFKRHSLNSVAAPISVMPHRSIVTLAPSPVRFFDAVTIIKIDIEGYEDNVIPAWAQGELRNVVETAPQTFEQGKLASIDFDAAADKYPSVSLVSMELHRMGHTSDDGSTLEGALRAHLTLLHAYSLGFLVVSQEKNHFDSCSYETNFASQRHFIRSEIWMVARDAM